MAVKIPCAVCSKKFALDQVGRGLFITTGVCAECYYYAQKLPAKIWCFASEEAYDEDSTACRELCPDRKICRKVLQGKIILPAPSIEK